ncbi:MAG: PduL/EutD family phosphate acyltransferase [bacterium]
MNSGGDSLESRVTILIEALLQMGETSAYVPVGVSARHLHISRECLYILFGKGYELKVYKPLRQPGQFSAEEKVTLVGPKGVLTDVRILGPVRNTVQVELSLTDCIKVGIQAYLPKGVHKSGIGGLTIVGPEGSITLTDGIMIAQRHLHTTPALAEKLKIRDGDEICAFIPMERSAILYGVLVRVRDDYTDELHLDTDEANALFVKSGDNALVFKTLPMPDEIYRMMKEMSGESLNIKKKFFGSDWYFEGRLLTERDVDKASMEGARRIRIRRGCIITPLSNEKAILKGIEIIID